VEPHIFGKGVLAVQTVKAALIAAIAIVALVVSLLPGLAEESGSLD
jgi:membrane-bound serine protease (ClpP class)